MNTAVTMKMFIREKKRSRRFSFSFSLSWMHLDGRFLFIGLVGRWKWGDFLFYIFNDARSSVLQHRPTDRPSVVVYCTGD